MCSQLFIRNVLFYALPKSDSGLIGLYASYIRASAPTRYHRGATEAFIEQVQNPAETEDVWVLDGSASNFAEVLGVIGLKRLGRRPSELGYWLAPAYWGVGLVCEAVRALIGANPQSSKTFLRRYFQENA